MSDRLSIEEGLARGFHLTYSVLAQGFWRWVGDGWVKDDEANDLFVKQHEDIDHAARP